MKGDKINCVVCGDLFTKNAPSQKYCCRDCSVKGAWLRTKGHIESRRYIIFERDAFRCFYCGKSSIEDRVVLVIDHLIPWSLPASTNDPENLVTACVECNGCKSNRVPSPENLARIQAEITRRTK